MCDHIPVVWEVDIDRSIAVPRVDRQSVHGHADCLAHGANASLRKWS
jgi:hypothetical protein